MFYCWPVSIDYPNSGCGYWYLVTAIGYYNNQIDKLSMVNRLIGEMRLYTVDVFYIVSIELLTQH